MLHILAQLLHNFPEILPAKRLSRSSLMHSFVFGTTNLKPENNVSSSFVNQT